MSPSRLAASQNSGASASEIFLRSRFIHRSDAFESNIQLYLLLELLLFWVQWNERKGPAFRGKNIQSRELDIQYFRNTFSMEILIKIGPLFVRSMIEHWQRILFYRIYAILKDLIKKSGPSFYITLTRDSKNAAVDFSSLNSFNGRLYITQRCLYSNSCCAHTEREFSYFK